MFKICKYYPPKVQKQREREIWPFELCIPPPRSILISESKKEVEPHQNADPITRRNELFCPRITSFGEENHACRRYGGASNGKRVHCKTGTNFCSVEKYIRGTGGGRHNVSVDYCLAILNNGRMMSCHAS